MLTAKIPTAKSGSGRNCLVVDNGVVRRLRSLNIVDGVDTDDGVKNDNGFRWFYPRRLPVKKIEAPDSVALITQTNCGFRCFYADAY